MTARLAALAFGLGLVAAAPFAAAAPAAIVKMDAATQSRIGVATQPLAAARRAASSTGFARVLDPVPLATLDADIAAAAAAYAASHAEAQRSQALNAADQTISRKAAEAARAQARADAAKLQLLQRRVGLEWGPGLAALSDAARGRLVADIAAGRAALVRIDSTQGLGAGRGTARIDLGPDGLAAVTLIGPTRSGDPRLQSTGALGIVRGPAALRLGVGSVAQANLETSGASSGVIVPRAALLRTGGATFAYVRRDAGAFERRPVTGGLPDPAGLFAPTGFRPGEAVVIRGAAQLFAAETAGQGAP